MSHLTCAKHAWLFYWMYRIMLAAIASRSENISWLNYNKSLIAQDECLWLATGFSLHPHDPPSSVCIQNGERECLEWGLTCFLKAGLVQTSFLLTVNWILLSHRAKGDWKTYFLHALRKKRLVLGEELAVSATICLSGHNILVYILLPTYKVYLPPMTENPQIHSVTANCLKFKIPNLHAPLSIKSGPGSSSKSDLWTESRLSTQKSSRLGIMLKSVTISGLCSQHM
jgi:hypothetical protein